MDDLSLVIAFVGAASILAVTPGVDTAIVLRSSMVDGKKSAGLASLGVALGCLAWGAVVSSGLGELIQTSQMAYTAVKYIGAVYLLWLGIKLLFLTPVVLNSNNSTHPSPNSMRAFRQGLFANLLNPKIGVFYVTFLPQFIPVSSNIAAYAFFLVCIHVVLSVLWFSILIMTTAPLNNFLRRPSVTKALDRVTAAIFISFAIKLALSPSR